MERIYFTQSNGVEILIEDLSNMNPGQEFTNMLEQARQLIATRPEKSVLAVMDVSGTHYNSDILNQVKDFVKANTPYIKASAVVGIEGLLSVALGAVNKFAGRNIRTCQSRAEAISWLETQT